MRNAPFFKEISRESNSFDLIRLFAALLVFLGHSFLIFGNRGIFNRELALLLGAAGVNIFFVISGFFVARSWVSKGSAKLFLKKRFLRIYPAFFVAVFAATFIMGPLVTFLGPTQYFHEIFAFKYLKTFLMFDLTDLSANVLPGVFVLNELPRVVNASLWTIPVEIFCYLLVLLLGLGGAIQKKVIPLVIFFSLLGGNLLLALNGDFQKYFQNFRHFPAADVLRLLTYFFAGMVIYVYRERLVLSKKHLGGIFLILALSAVGGYFELLSLFLLPLLVIMAGFIKKDPFRWLTDRGDFSYGFYLFAFPVQQLTAQLFAGKISFLAQLLFAFIMTMLFAVFSWQVVERRFLRSKGSTVHK